MSASLNRVMIIGHLGKDPESKFMPNGDAVCNITVATSETWKDKSSGEKREATEWHRIVFFRKLAEIAGQYLTKGSQVYISGALKTRKWTDKDGVERYTTEITADEMKMLGGKGNGNSDSSSQGGSPRADKPAQSGEAGNFDDDDIPF